jgi:hypothetical protein
MEYDNTEFGKCVTRISRKFLSKISELKSYQNKHKIADPSKTALSLSQTSLPHIHIILQF